MHDSQHESPRSTVDLIAANPHLGRVGDRRLARHLGVDWRVVRRVRLERGVPPCQRRSVIDWSQVADLGERPDGEIAQRLGCDPSTVARARKRSKIAAYKRTEVLS